MLKAAMFIIKHFITAILMVCALSFNSQAQEQWSPPPNYYAPAAGLSGPALQNALHDIIDDHNEVEYSWPPFLDLDASAANASRVDLIYTDATSSKGNNGGAIGNWNREHLWPRSSGIGHDGPDNSDLFNLRPSDVQVNAERGSLIFDNTDPKQSLPLQFLATGCSKDHDSWEPRNDEKGDIARSCFYMATRYDGTDPDTSNLRLSDHPHAPSARFGKLRTLIQWHYLDPVDQAEKKRNQRIYTHWQGNRNPFIDHPEFAGLVFLAAYPAIDHDNDGLGDWWEYREFGNLGMSGRDDPDNDSAANLIEFAVGTSPMNTGEVPKIHFSTQDGNIQVSYNWNPIAASTGLTATIQSSATLRPGSWTNVQPLSKTSTQGQPGFDYMTLKLPFREQSKRVFYRLHILAATKIDFAP